MYADGRKIKTLTGEETRPFLFCVAASAIREAVTR